MMPKYRASQLFSLSQLTIAKDICWNFLSEDKQKEFLEKAKQLQQEYLNKYTKNKGEKS